MSFVVIGKNSFIASHLKKITAGSEWVFMSHNEALENDKWTLDADVIVNFAFSPQLYKHPYRQEDDIDFKIANKIKDLQHTHYIMISSRAIYGNKEYLKETSETQPNSNYGASKLIIEKSLIKLLGKDRITILRCSNIFGTGLGEHTFIGQSLSSLRKDNEITFDMSAETEKDFVPVEHVCSVIKQVAEHKLAGIYNVGLGISTSCGNIAKWLIHGYGQGNLNVINNTIRGQFFMDVSKITKALDLQQLSSDLIKQECIKLGQNLK